MPKRPAPAVKIQHHGIILVDPESFEWDRPPQREWPTGFTSHGDSFLVWGEHRQGDLAEADYTLHVIYEGPLSFAKARFMLSNVLRRGERLIDYAVLSDKDDWSEAEETFTLEQFEYRWSQ